MFEYPLHSLRIEFALRIDLCTSPDTRNKCLLLFLGPVPSLLLPSALGEWEIPLTCLTRATLSLGSRIVICATFLLLGALLLFEPLLVFLESVFILSEPAFILSKLAALLSNFSTACRGFCIIRSLALQNRDI